MPIRSTMPITWALVADRSEARILESRASSRSFVLVEDISHPQGHFQDRDVGTDKQGRAFDRAGQSRHAMEPRQSPHEHEAQRFAQELADKLRQARHEHRFERLVLAAEPHFLGVLRDALDAQTRKTVVAEVRKHLLGAGDGDLATHLADALLA